MKQCTTHFSEPLAITRPAAVKGHHQVAAARDQLEQLQELHQATTLGPGHGVTPTKRHIQSGAVPAITQSKLVVKTLVMALKKPVRG